MSNTTITKKLQAIGNRVLVSDMHFGEQTTNTGIVISSDNGKTRGIYPRWGKVYSKGPDNKDPYQVGDWILVVHGRWTRSIPVEHDGNKLTVRMVETESILAFADEKPSELNLGNEYTDGQHATVDPASFINQ